MNNTNTTIGQLQVGKNSEVHFAICNSCFWCASVFRSEMHDGCPSCRNRALDMIPISKDEKYVFEFNEKRGIVLDFVPTKKK
jgi:hypothetical protein